MKLEENAKQTCFDCKVPVSMIVFLSIFYGLIALVAFIGNTFVIYVVTVSRRMRVSIGHFDIVTPLSSTLSLSQEECE